MTKGWTRPRAEVLTQLETQKNALAASCEGYDKGNKWEALRLATITHVLVHDSGKKIKSVLSQLGVRGSLRFASSGHANYPGNLVRETTLVGASIRMTEHGPVSEYIPFLDKGPYPIKKIQFSDWWESEKIFNDPDGTSLNRKRLVFALRNEEGGAHLGEKLRDTAYFRLAREEDGATHFGVSGKAETPLMDAHLASMRQIAWELQETLKDVPTLPP